MMRIKRWIGMLLCMFLCVGILPTAVFAADPVEQVMVNGKDITQESDYTVQCGNGWAVYDPDTHTLTLENVAISVHGTSAGAGTAGIVTNGELTVLLKGKNIIDTSVSQPNSYSIWVNKGLTIKGLNGGTLEAVGGIKSQNDLTITDTEISVAYNTNPTIWTSAGSLNIQEATVTAEGTSYALYAPSGSISITEKSKVQALTSHPYNGINGKSIDISSSEVTATGNTALQSTTKTNIIDSTLTLEGMRGIIVRDPSQTQVYGSLSIENSVLDIDTQLGVIESGETTLKDCVGTITGGLMPDTMALSFDVKGDFLVLGNKTDLIVTGDNGIQCNGNMVIDGGKFSSVGNSFSAVGINVNGIFRFNSGELRAKGGSAAIMAMVYSEDANKPTEDLEAIVINENYAEINRAKLANSELEKVYINNEERWRCRASFIAEDDNTGVLASPPTNTVKEVTIKIRPADYSQVGAAIVKANALNKDDYKDFTAVEAAIKAVVRDKDITKQAEVDAMAKAIEDAITALKYKPADYSQVDAAIAKAEALNKDEYKDFSGVEAAINAVIWNKNITEQEAVNAMAKAIEDAIAALEYKPADYSKVDEAIAEAKALKKEEYKDFSAVEAAIKAVIRDKNITEQTEVDAMAKAIESAIDGLEKKPTESEKPTDPDKENPGEGTDSPQTGDNSYPFVWIMLAFVSSSAVLTLTVKNRKKNESVK